jgi:transcriptional regulator with XRE-family HTH domain
MSLPPRGAGPIPVRRLSERLADKLRVWFQRRGHGSQAALVTFSKERPGGLGITAQNLSYFLNRRRGKPLGLDALDDLAAYFNVSVGELVDEAYEPELSGQEQRLLRAWRAMPPALQHHFLALVEPAALYVQQFGYPLPPEDESPS